MIPVTEWQAPGSGSRNSRTMSSHFQMIGGWGWKRSRAESPTGNPSPAPSASAAHASHARHDRSMARWISVARAKVGGFGSSPIRSRKVALSRGYPFVHFETGNVTVFLRTCLSQLIKIKVWRIFVHLSKELHWFSSPHAAKCLSHQGIIMVLRIIVDFSKEFQCFFVRLSFKLYFRLRPES